VIFTLRIMTLATGTMNHGGGYPGGDQNSTAL
jgi:hypothetical protein